MSDELRERVGVLSALVVLVLVMACCNDGVGPTPCLSHPAPAPLSAPVLSPFPWQSVSLTFESTGCRSDLLDPQIAACAAATPSKHHGLRGAIEDWMRKRKEQEERPEIECVPEPPAPDCVRHNQPVQIGIKF